MKPALACVIAIAITTISYAQEPSAIAGRSPGSVAPTVTLPSDTVIQVTPVEEISSINMHVGDEKQLQVAADVGQDGMIVIPRGAPVQATVIWRTGKGIGGKSAKFDLAFESVTVKGTRYKLKGKHRQEGRGNTMAALFGSMIITGKSAVISSGQMMNAFTAEPVPAL